MPCLLLRVIHLWSEANDSTDENCVMRVWLCMCVARASEPVEHAANRCNVGIFRLRSHAGVRHLHLCIELHRANYFGIICACMRSEHESNVRPRASTVIASSCDCYHASIILGCFGTLFPIVVVDSAVLCVGLCVWVCMWVVLFPHLRLSSLCVANIGIVVSASLS